MRSLFFRFFFSFLVIMFIAGSISALVFSTMSRLSVESAREELSRDFTGRIARFILVSLPTASLSGRHPKVDQDRRLMDESVHGQNWLVDEILFPNEIVFCIRKAA